MLEQTASLAISAINGTGGSLASAALDGARRRLGGGGAGGSGFEVLRGMVEKRQFRIPCVDVLVRL